MQLGNATDWLRESTRWPYGPGVSGIAIEDVLPIHLSTVVFPDFHPLRGQVGDVLGFAVRHSRGVVLFDTGIGTDSALIDRYYQPTSVGLEEALAHHGHVLGDVVAIVNSHLHFHHCGNNPLFPGVPIYAQAQELEAAREPQYTVPQWIEFEGAEYRAVDGGADVAAGIHVVPTPGHTTGHQSLVLDARDGAIVLAGQAVYSRVEYDHIRQHDSVPDVDPAPDKAIYLESARQLVGLDPRRVHFSHDREVWHRPEDNNPIS